MDDRLLETLSSPHLCYLLVHLVSMNTGLQILTPVVLPVLTIPSWGAAAMCAGAVDNMAELIVCRCLLGVFEAAFGAGAPYFLSLFYQRRELGFRVSILLGMSPIANCFASSLAYGITHIRHSTLESWRFLFIIGKPSYHLSLLWNHTVQGTNLNRGRSHCAIRYSRLLLPP